MVRKPSKMSNPSANIKEKDVCDWFAEAKEEILKIKGGEAAPKDPRQVYNADETGFALDTNTG